MGQSPLFFIKNLGSMLYHCNFTDLQRTILKIIFPPLAKKLRKHDTFDILEAIFLIVKTGMQWGRLPKGYPPHSTVYYHYRCWGEDPGLENALHALVLMKRSCQGQTPEPSLGVVDSQSVRTGLPHAESGVDGGKKVKGIKRHIMTDKNGFPLGVHVTLANVHDSKGAEPLIANVLSLFRNISVIKADLGYRGAFKDMPFSELGVIIECVKSNYGTPEFIPIQHRWVVERAFAWLQNYRRLTSNFEKYRATAKAMTLFASVFFMVRYFG